MKRPLLVHLGIGANLGDPVANIDRALRLLASKGVDLRRRAPLYRSIPVGPVDQPDYVNTVAEIAAALSPTALLLRLKQIERELGRRPGARWGPRPIDLDILLYGDLVCRTPDLTVPHAELARRRFALAPLCDLIPDRVVPGIGRTVRDLLESLEEPPESVRRIASP